MFMKDDSKKKIAALIIAKKIPSGESEMKEAPKDEYGDMTSYDTGLMQAAEEILSAVEKKDAKMIKEALKSFMSMCTNEEEDSERDSEED
jgi:NTP pyrophosphatase (non-canonical NTP hydrolase)